MTYAERAYYSRHKKQVESTEDYLHRVTVAYNEIYSLINKVNDSKGCIQGTIFYLMSSMRKIQKQNR